ncbi:glycosyltransferase family 4 protein [Candidatus Saccharibacteria bacterium]|nr:glycosyltransferase family 4 protein [Candidatus Saccharibacteria bacterium]
MKLFIDARWTRTDYHDGISRYTAGVVQGFKDAKIPITILIHDPKQLNLLPSDIPYEIINNPISFKELFVARTINKLGADVVFSPLQIMGSWGRKYKLILTLQDIIYYRFPKPPTNLPQWIRAVWRLFHSMHWPQRWLLNHADYVSTVSYNSKKFINEMHLTDREIVVVYNASSLDLSKIKPVAKRNRNIIYMGSFMPYKNVEVLIRGLKYLPKTYVLHLLSKISPERKIELEKLIPRDRTVVFHNGTSDEEYIELLNEAACLATGSKVEGFGLPIVEAQTIGTPVILNDLEIFHEVAGDGALFFKADNFQQFAEQVLKLEDRKVHDDLVEKGRKQAAKFAWSKSAKALYEVCQELYDQD